MSTDKLAQIVKALQNADSLAPCPMYKEALAAALAAQAEQQAPAGFALAPGEHKRKLSPFDAVARAMDMASLMAGAVARSDVAKTNGYSADLRSHLIEYIYPASQPSQPAPKQAEQQAVRPFLVRDVAALLGTDVHAVCAAAVALGKPPTSTNSAIDPEEALQVQAHLAAPKQAEQQEVPDYSTWPDEGQKCRDCADFGPICPNSGKPCGGAA